MLRRDFLKTSAIGVAALSIPVSENLNLGALYHYGRIEVSGLWMYKNTSAGIALEIKNCGRDWERQLRRAYETSWAPSESKFPYVQKAHNSNLDISHKPVILPGAAGVVDELPEQANKISAYVTSYGLLENRNGEIWYRKPGYDVYTATFYLYLRTVRGLHDYAVLPAQIPAWLDSEISTLITEAHKVGLYAETNIPSDTSSI